VGDPSPGEFRTLFEVFCRSFGCDYRPEAVDYLIDTHYRAFDRPLRRCQPRDLLTQIHNYCVYHDIPMELRPDYLDRVVHSYFTAVSGG
jgi:hypothetical protein